MARITVEDCLDNVENLFDLVIIASKRARRLANGATPLVDWENDKPTVVALREIAEGLVTKDTVDQIDQAEDDLLSSEEAERLLAESPLSQMPGEPGALGGEPGPGPMGDRDPGADFGRSSGSELSQGRSGGGFGSGLGEKFGPGPGSGSSGGGSGPFGNG